jgi:hypothetical protein
MDALYQPVFRLDVEATTGPDGNAAQVGAYLLAFRHHRLDHIARLEPKRTLAAGEIATRKTVLCQPGALIASSPRRFEAEYRLLPVFNGIDVSNAGSVQTMFFGNL